jgi:hypothetical protein
MDNRQFNVNGSGLQMLIDAINLACQQQADGSGIQGIVAWIVIPNKGLVWLWAKHDVCADAMGV